MKSKVAVFNISVVFKITGRGIVFGGLILEGEVSKGDVVQIASKECRINSVEFIDGKSQEYNIGLLVLASDSEEDVLLKTAPQIVTIYKN